MNLLFRFHTNKKEGHSSKKKYKCIVINFQFRHLFLQIAPLLQRAVHNAEYKEIFGVHPFTLSPICGDTAVSVMDIFMIPLHE